MSDMEIICVGNELLIGKTLNTNSQWISKRATALGVAVKRITVVGDDIEEIADIILEAKTRKPQFILTTGGLGPTFDDKTLEGIAKALNRNLQISQEALRMVEEKYEKYAKERKNERLELTQPRLKMARLPEETLPIPNPVGTAPSVRADLDGTILVALPGVPSEMKAIFEETIVSLLRQKSGQKGFFERSLFADNIIESTLAPLIETVMRKNPQIFIKSHPKREENRPHIEIHFSTTTRKTENVEEKLEKAMDQLSHLIADVDGKVIIDNHFEA